MGQSCSRAEKCGGKGETGSNVFILPAAGNFSRPVSICGNVTCASVVLFCVQGLKGL